MLSEQDIALLFEPDPYSYECAVSSPDLPVSPSVQIMRDQEALFYAAFPDARRAAELRQRRKAEILAFLAAPVVSPVLPFCSLFFSSLLCYLDQCCHLS